MVGYGGAIKGGGPGLTLTSGQVGSWQIENPSGSGVNIQISAIRVWATASGVVRYIVGATSTGTSRTPSVQDLTVSYTPLALVKSGIGVLTGGTTLDIEGRADASDHYFFNDGPITIPPNTKCAITYTAPATGAMAYLIATWSEIAA
jgi:hypothetical protein